jgi:hypothetical protein
MVKQKRWLLQWHNEQHGTVILCKDGTWRKCPDYGDYKECVKFWTSANWALRVVRHKQGEYTAIKLSEQSENCLGQIH